MVNLPWDVLSDILVRLPAKSIARFRCVNKVWCKFLKNPEFLKTQYKYAVEMNRLSILVRNVRDIITFTYDPSSSMFWISGHFKYRVKFFGCCNGLILLRLCNKLHELVLWNPLTDEFKKLPDPPTRLSLFVECSIGYDHQIEDFKVVCIAQEFYGYCCEVQVYTLRSNSWRRLEAVYMRSSTFDTLDMGRLTVNGASHWKVLGEDKRTEIILRFDFEKEEFDRIPIPDSVNHDKQARLCVFGGSLWLLGDKGRRGEEIMEFWEMKDDGVKKSWNHPFAIDKYKIKDMGDMIPLGFLENGKILFGVYSGHCALRFVLYDQEHKRTGTLNRYPYIAASSLLTSVYVENLISLGTGTYLEKERSKKKEEKEQEEEDGDYSEVEEDEDGDYSEVEEEEEDDDDGGSDPAVAGSSNYDGNEKDIVRRMKKNKTT